MLCFFSSVAAIYCAPQQKVFETRYTFIYYDDENDLDTFLWKIGGEKQEYINNPPMAAARVDGIVQRVRSILDVWPKKFKISVFLQKGELTPNKEAYYDKASNSIRVSIDYASDGVFAHEIAHAVIHANYNDLLPSRVEEILTRYVDKYLWGDY